MGLLKIVQRRRSGVAQPRQILQFRKPVIFSTSLKEIQMKKLAIAMIAAMSLSAAAFAEEHTATTTTETPAATTETTHHTDKAEHKGHDGKKMHKKTKKTEKHEEHKAE
jgi:predicted GTPase